MKKILNNQLALIIELLVAIERKLPGEPMPSMMYNANTGDTKEIPNQSN